MAPPDPPKAEPKPISRPVMSSCMVGGVSTVYFVDINTWVKSYVNDLSNITNAKLLDIEVVASQTVQRQDYQPKPVNVTDGGNTTGVQSKTRDIAALSFELANPKDTTRSRLYYIDGTGSLAELRQDNASTAPLTSIGGWTKGKSLQDKGYKVKENSPITAHLSSAMNMIKVYYYPRDYPTQQWVAWWVGDGSETWQTQPIIADMR